MTKFTIAISDIHGQLEQFKSLMAHCGEFIRQRQIPLADVTFVFCGDYIDRGPHSRQVLDELLKIEADRSPMGKVFLRGNHDEMMLQTLRYRNGGMEDCWFANGGIATLENYAEGDVFGRAAIDPHLDFIERMKLWHEDDDRVYVHAGVRGDFTDMSKQAKDDLLWMRLKEVDAHWPANAAKTVIHGHTPFHMGLAGKTIGIDGGAFMQRGALKAVIFCSGNAYPVGTLAIPSDGVHRTITHPEGGHA